MVQGITIPVIAQISWLAEIAKGQSVPVAIEYGDGHVVPAIVRRIDNSRGHLQFRYETKKQAPLRDYLGRVFGEPERASGVLKIVQLKPRAFRFEPVSVGRKMRPSLVLTNPHFHNCSGSDVKNWPEFRELDRCLGSIDYDEEFNQSRYNLEIAERLSKMGWRSETQVIKEIGLRCDFVKNDIWVEVEFGNARVYYQDFIKFLLAFRHRSARLGVLLCPTNAFAQLLCDLGQRRAALRQLESATRRPYYSGMMSYEKAIRELPFLQFMLTGSMLIGGIEIETVRREPTASPSSDVS